MMQKAGKMEASCHVNSGRVKRKVVSFGEDKNNTCH